MEIKEIISIAKQYGYTQTFHSNRTGVIIFEFEHANLDHESNFIISVWYICRTVGVTQPHPRLRRIQSFFFDVDEKKLQQIFLHPRLNRHLKYVGGDWITYMPSDIESIETAIKRQINATELEISSLTKEKIYLEKQLAQIIGEHGSSIDPTYCQSSDKSKKNPKFNIDTNDSTNPPIEHINKNMNNMPLNNTDTFCNEISFPAMNESLTTDRTEEYMRQVPNIQGKEIYNNNMKKMTNQSPSLINQVKSFSPHINILPAPEENSSGVQHHQQNSSFQVFSSNKFFSYSSENKKLDNDIGKCDKSLQSQNYNDNNNLSDESFIEKDKNNQNEVNQIVPSSYTKQQVHCDLLMPFPKHETSSSPPNTNSFSSKQRNAEYSHPQSYSSVFSSLSQNETHKEKNQNEYAYKSNFYKVPVSTEVAPVSRSNSFHEKNDTNRQDHVYTRNLGPTVAGSSSSSLVSSKFRHHSAHVSQYPPPQTAGQQGVGVLNSTEMYREAPVRYRGNRCLFSFVNEAYQEEFGKSWSLKPVNCVALGVGYIIVYEGGGISWWDAPLSLDRKFRDEAVRLPAVQYVTLGPDGNYFIKFFNGKMEWIAKSSFQRAIRKGASERSLYVDKVALGANGSWVILWTDGSVDFEGIPKDLATQLEAIHEGPGLRDISLGPHGEWFAIFKDHSVQANNLPTPLHAALGKIKKSGGRVRNVVFGAADSWYVRYWDGESA